MNGAEGLGSRSEVGVAVWAAGPGFAGSGSYMVVGVAARARKTLRGGYVWGLPPPAGRGPAALAM